MGNDISVRLDGIDELQKKFEKLTKAHNPNDVEKASLKAAEVIRAEAEKTAPLGPTGRLKEAQIKKPLKKGKDFASAIVAIDRAIAYYGGIVTEYGSPYIEPNPFFRNAVRNKAPKAYKTLKDELDRMTKEAVR